MLILKCLLSPASWVVNVLFQIDWAGTILAHLSCQLAFLTISWPGIFSVLPRVPKDLSTGYILRGIYENSIPLRSKNTVLITKLKALKIRNSFFLSFIVSVYNCSCFRTSNLNMGWDHSLIVQIQTLPCSGSQKSWYAIFLKELHVFCPRRLHSLCARDISVHQSPADWLP